MGQNSQLMVCNWSPCHNQTLNSSGYCHWHANIGSMVGESSSDRRMNSIREFLAAPPRTVAGEKKVIQSGIQLRDEMYGDPIEIVENGQSYYAQMGWDKQGEAATLLIDESGSERVVHGHIADPEFGTLVSQKSYTQTNDQLSDTSLRNLQVNALRGNKRVRRKAKRRKREMARQRRESRRANLAMRNPSTRARAQRSARGMHRAPTMRLSRRVVSATMGTIRMGMWSLHTMRSLFLPSKGR